MFDNTADEGFWSTKQRRARKAAKESALVGASKSSSELRRILLLLLLFTAFSCLRFKIVKWAFLSLVGSMTTIGVLQQHDGSSGSLPEVLPPSTIRQTSRRAIRRVQFWLLIGALMIATRANAQRPEVLPGCESGNAIPFHVESQWGSGPALEQETTAGASPASSNATPNPWAFFLTTSGYIVPDGQSYVSPDFSADRGWIHLEARYNDEALETGSLWAGYNFSAGKKLVLDATPMLGGVFGNLNGVAPGYLVTLTYKRVQLYSQGEYVFDTRNRGSNFFYSWNQITYPLLNWLEVGLVAQRTRVYHTSLNVQRGVLVGFTYKKVNLRLNVFNFGWTTPTEVLSLGLNF